MRLPVTLAALAAAAFLALPVPAHAGGVHEVASAVHRIGSDFFAFVTYPFRRDAAPATPEKVVKAKAKAAPKKV